VTAETQGMPQLIASSGVFALAHAIEAYLSRASSPITDAAALHSIRLITAHLRRAVFDADDLTARNMISFADYLAGMAFNSAGLGWVTCMTNALCSEYIAAPASECAAVLLPHALRYYGGGSETTRELFIDIAEAMGCAKNESADDAVAACVLATARLVADLKLPETLRELTASRKLRMQKKEIPRLALRALRDTAAITAARSATLGEVEQLFLCAWDVTLSNTSCSEARSKCNF
jgi:alcohol dehydrogenase